MTLEIPTDSDLDRAQSEFEHMTIGEIAEELDEGHGVRPIHVLREMARFAAVTDLFPIMKAEFDRQILDEYDPGDEDSLEEFVKGISEASPAHAAWRSAMMLYARRVGITYLHGVPVSSVTTIEQEWVRDRALDIFEERRAGLAAGERHWEEATER